MKGHRLKPILISPEVKDRIGVLTAVCENDTFYLEYPRVKLEQLRDRLSAELAKKGGRGARRSSASASSRYK